MSIVLPPPIPPQPAPVEQLQAEASQELQIDFRGLRFHVFGPLVPHNAVDAGLLRRQVAVAETASDAIRLIGYLCYAHGYPSTLVSYGLAGNRDVYVRLVAGQIGEVRGPSELTGYFRDLAQEKPLRGSDLERDRTLADVQSERAGENFHP